MFGIVNYDVFIISGILLNLIPGADTIYILGISLSNGKKAGIFSVLGISTGCFIHTIIAASGLSIILSESVLVFDIVKYMGALYLIYLGIRSLLSKKQTLIEKNNNIVYGIPKIYVQGVLTNVLNPKVALFFMAFLPQFINNDNSYGSLPFLLLGATFIFTGTLWCIILAITSSFAAEKVKRNSKTSTILNKLSGCVFIGLGINLFRSKLAK
jgi:threonine/homoserine/homoserine lactone efflux protein